MKSSLIALFVVGVFSQSCTIVDYMDKKDKVRRVEQLVKIGDDIGSATRTLIANDFSPSSIHSNGSQPTSGYYFTLYLREPTTIDDLSYAFQADLEPWRMGIPKMMKFQSGPDEIISSIEIEKN
jgi:hypothetical protein